MGRLLVGAVKRRAAVGLCIAVGALVAAGCGTPADEQGGPRTADFLRAVERLPQNGATIGLPDAPHTLTVTADPSDLAFAQVAWRHLTPVLAGPVSTGQVNVVLQPSAAGSDELGPAASDELLRALFAAGRQQRLWTALAHVLTEYAGFWHRDTSIDLFELADVPDRQRATEDLDAPAVAAAVARSRVRARAAGYRGRPTLRLRSSEGREAALRGAAADRSVAAQIRRLISGWG